MQKNVKKVAFLPILLFLFIVAPSAKAATCTWVSTGNLFASDPINWTSCNGTAPTATDDVVINTGSQSINWNSTSTSQVASLTLGSSYSGTLTLNRSLTVSGDVLKRGGTLALGTQTLTVNGGDIGLNNTSMSGGAGSVINLSGTGTLHLNNASLTNTALNVTGGFITISSGRATFATTTVSGGTLSLGTSSVLYVKSAIVDTGATLTSSTTAEGADGFNLGRLSFSQSYGYLGGGGTINPSGLNIGTTASTSIATSGTFSGYCAFGPGQLGETSLINITSGNTLTCGKFIAQTNVVSQNLTINVNNSATLVVSGAAYLMNVNPNPFTLNLPNVLTLNSFDGTLNFQGSLEISNGAQTTTAADVVSFRLGGGGSMTVAGAGNITSTSTSSGAAILFDSGGKTINWNGGLNIGHNSSAASAADIYYDLATSTQTIAGSLAITDSSNSTSNASITLSATSSTGTLSISGDYTVTDGAGSATLTLRQQTGTTTFNGSSDQTITTAGLARFANLVINNSGSSGSDDITISGALDIDGNLTITDGDLDTNTNDPVISVGGAISVGASGSWDRGSGNLTLDGTTTFIDSSNSVSLGDVFVASSTAVASLTLGSNATSTYLHIGSGETVSQSSYTLNLANTSATTTPLVIVGTFTPGTGKTVYKGSAATTIAPAIYYNLETFGSGVAYTVSASTTASNNLTNTAGTIELSGGPLTVSGTFSNADTLRETSSFITGQDSSLSLDASSYSVAEGSSGTLTITVIDYDGNTVGTSTQTLASTTVTVSSGSDSELLTLTETGIATGIFTGTLSFTKSDSVSVNDGTLQAPGAGTITVNFTDQQDSSDTSSDTATLSFSASSSGGTSGGGTGAVVFFGGGVINTPSNLSQTNIQNTNTETVPIPTLPQDDLFAKLVGPFSFEMSSPQVTLLQQILARDISIYPEGKITGYYGSLTRAAVGRFQEKYGLATKSDDFYGLAGPKTRAKINEVFGGQASQTVTPTSPNTSTGSMTSEERQALIQNIVSQIEALKAKVAELLQAQISTLQNQIGQ